MASIILASAGSAIGSQVGGPIGAIIGKKVAGAIGGRLDDKIFGSRRLADVHGPRLEELSVQTSTYGKSIPLIYGNARIAGNVIWGRPIKELATTNSNSAAGGKGGGGKVTQKQTTYNYYATIAIAICEGEIDDVVRVWADTKVVNPKQGNYRLYRGGNTQNPDPLIEGYEGIGKTPAYRGMAYVVIEDFPLADFGNRIPNFTFEVKRKLIEENSVETKINAVVIIPGSGEFVYDTMVQEKSGGEYVGGDFIQSGLKNYVNQNNRDGKADALVSLDQLKQDLPNVNWVSVTVGWFGTSLDAGDCEILPGVEFSDGGETSPNNWAVASYNRSTAHQITLSSGSPIYGGTPDDESLVRYVTELRDRGYNILFYPLIFMDVSGKPWRGRITGSPSEVASFFTKTNGYNSFINHYADLLSGKVDAFVIGSELIGITKVKDGSNNFAGVSALVDLAQSVKTTLGSSIKVTYAADWSEYHHTDDGWYNLDPLWASAYIDVIGIDAYFPLTDEIQDGYNKQQVINGWTEGEGYDWYYSDPERTNKVNLSPAFAWKNIEYWWSHSHTNPDSSTTSWIPNSKKIWFTEFGFPSVDGCTNQPNVFYDPNSSESAFPYHSQGRVDFRAQRNAIEATLDKWAGSSMVERMFLWAWDARPYPFYPDLREVWSDGNLWIFGHWINGKMGLSSLAAIISDICKKIGLAEEDLDLSKVSDLVDGFVSTSIVPSRALLEQLQTAYFFDSVESSGKLRFVTRGNDYIVEIDENELVPENNNSPTQLLKIIRKQEIELPEKVDVNYIDRLNNYESGTQHYLRSGVSTKEKSNINLPVILNDFQARRIAQVSLYNAWVARNEYEFSLPIKYAALEPADVIKIDDHILRLTETLLGANGEIRCKGVMEEKSVYDFYSSPANKGGSVITVEDSGQTKLEILDLPAFPNDDPQKATMRFAASGVSSAWRGAVIFRSDDGGVSYNPYVSVDNSSVQGNVVNVLPDSNTEIFDNSSKLEVILISGELESVSELAVLNGANVALVGNEIIQFKSATLLSGNKYELTGLLRGRLGTENYTSSHLAGERFILLDGRIMKETVGTNLIGLERVYKPATIGKTLAQTTPQNFTFYANSLKPYSPAKVRGERDGGGNISISWTRRTRVGGELRDGADVPLSEEFEKYEVDILDGVDVVRVLSITAPLANYSSAEQVADFGANQSSLSIRVYQISAVVGRGIAATAII